MVIRLDISTYGDSGLVKYLTAFPTQSIMTNFISLYDLLYFKTCNKFRALRKISIWKSYCAFITTSNSNNSVYLRKFGYVSSERKNLPHKSLSMYNKGHHLKVRSRVCIICEPLG